MAGSTNNPESLQSSQMTDRPVIQRLSTPPRGYQRPTRLSDSPNFLNYVTTIYGGLAEEKQKAVEQERLEQGLPRQEPTTITSGQLQRQQEKHTPKAKERRAANRARSKQARGTDDTQGPTRQLHRYDSAGRIIEVFQWRRRKSKFNNKPHRQSNRH